MSTHFGRLSGHCDFLNFVLATFSGRYRLISFLRGPYRIDVALEGLVDGRQSYVLSCRQIKRLDIVIEPANRFENHLMNST